MCDASDRLKSSGWDESLFKSLLFCDCFEVSIRRVFATHTVPRDYSIGPYDVLQQTPIARQHQSHFGGKRMWEERGSVGRVRLTGHSPLDILQYLLHWVSHPETDSYV